MFYIIKWILILDREITDTNYERLEKTLVYIKNNSIDSDGNMHLTVDSFIKINSIITGLNNITLKKKLMKGDTDLQWCIYKVLLNTSIL